AEHKIAAIECDRSQCCRRFVRLQTQSTLESSLQKNPACSAIRTGKFDQRAVFGSNVQCTSSCALHFAHAKPNGCRSLARDHEKIASIDWRLTAVKSYTRRCPDAL